MADYLHDNLKDLRNFTNEAERIQAEFAKLIKEGAAVTKIYANSWKEVGAQIAKTIDPVTYIGKQIQEQQRRIDVHNAAEKAYANQILELGKRKTELDEKYAENRSRAAALVVKSDGLGLTPKENKKLKALEEEIAAYGDINDALTVAKKNADDQLKTAKAAREVEEKALKGLNMQAAVLNIIKDTWRIIWVGMKAGMHDYDKFLSEQAKQLGVSKNTIDEQYTLARKFNGTWRENLTVSREIISAQTRLKQEYAVTGEQSLEIANSIAQTAKSTGLTVDEATKLQSILAEIGGTSLLAQNHMAGFAIQVAKAYGVPLNVILKDVVSISNSVKVIFRGNTEELIKQAAEARKLGSSLDSAGKSAESLLNFETSIAAELKASALLGQSLNFNESRRLFFQKGAIEGEKALQKELEKLGDINQLNYNQRKALEQATGKEFGELQRIYTQRKNQAEMEKRFPEEAEKLRKLQRELNDLQQKSKGGRDAELKKMLEQQKVETQLQLMAVAKTAAMDRLAQILKPIYDWVTKIQTQFYGWISKLDDVWIWTGIVVGGLLSIGLTVASLVVSFNFLGMAVGRTALSIGTGLGNALSRLAVGVRSLGRALIGIPLTAFVGISLLMLAMAGAAWGVSKAIENLGTVSVGQILAFTAGMAGMMIALAIFGAYMLPANPLSWGIWLLIAALGALSLEALAVGKALQMAGPGMDAIGAALVKIAGIGWWQLTKVGAALASLTYSFGALGLALVLFPGDKFESITRQIDMLSKSAGGLSAAAKALKEFSDIKVPTITGAADAIKLASELQNMKLPTITNSGVSEVVGSSNTTKKDSSEELKTGIQMIVTKLDDLTKLMVGGGIAVYLNGVKVSYAMNKAVYEGGSYQAATKP